VTTIRRATVADAAGIARVHIDSWRAAYRGLVPQAHLDGLSYASREERWHHQLTRGVNATFVAVDDHTIVGFVDCGERTATGLDTDGELYAIYLLPSHFRRGLGQQLFAAARRELSARGCRSLGLWVLRDNAACAFYAALGGVRAGRGEHFVGGACLDKVAFVWDLGAAQPDPVGGG
jgi:ribosomal protein S18 acetylase RimI-like enzyme